MRTSLYESEAEQTRERIASTVDDLQTRLSPRNMVNDAVGTLQDSGMALFDSAKQLCRDHPVAVSLIGASIGLLLINRDRVSASRDSYIYYSESDDMDGYDATADDNERSGRVQRGWDKVRTKAGDASSRLSERADSAREQMSEKWSSARERTSDYAHRARQSASAARQRASDGFDANPVAGVLIGVAVGALLGALLPRSRRENELLGETRDRVADAAKSAARAAADASRQQLDQMGVNIDNAKAKLGEIGNQAKDVARTATQAATSEIRGPSTGNV